MTKRKRISGELLTGLFFLFLIAALMIYAYFFSPYDMNELTSAGKLAPPSLEHPFGTDHLSRDLLTRVGQGSAGSLIVALGTVALGAILGFFIGSAAGYFGGFLDWLLSRVIDSLLAFPALLMALLVVSVWDRGIPQLIVALGIAFTPSFARIVRSVYQVQRQREFVKRLEVMGAPPLRILFLHISPLLKEQYLNAIAIGLANAILAESSMSFIGFGVQAPKPSWGGMLSDARAYVFQAPWLAIFPGLCIVLTVLAIFLIKRSGLFKYREDFYEQ